MRQWFAALMLLSAGSVSAEENVMLVLDASGSMWGQIDGKAKIEIAREAVDQLAVNWKPENRLGLVAYGHRRKGDCGDIETLIPVGAADPKAVIAAVEAITPKGKTPLTAAVKQAAEQLRYTEDAATVILISDGLETCDADPCTVATSLAESGVAFRTHVIGFDLKKKEQEALRCLAENTGGVFIAAPIVLGFEGLDALYYWANGAAVLVVCSLHKPESAASQAIAA